MTIAIPNSPKKRRGSIRSTTKIIKSNIRALDTNDINSETPLRSERSSRRSNTMRILPTKNLSASPTHSNAGSSSPSRSRKRTQTTLIQTVALQERLHSFVAETRNRNNSGSSSPNVHDNVSTPSKSTGFQLRLEKVSTEAQARKHSMEDDLLRVPKMNNTTDSILKKSNGFGEDKSSDEKSKKDSEDIQSNFQEVANMDSIPKNNRSQRRRVTFQEDMLRSDIKAKQEAIQQKPLVQQPIIQPLEVPIQNTIREIITIPIQTPQKSVQTPKNPKKQEEPSSNTIKRTPSMNKAFEFNKFLKYPSTTDENSGNSNFGESKGSTDKYSKDDKSFSSTPQDDSFYNNNSHNDNSISNLLDRNQESRKPPRANAITRTRSKTFDLIKEVNKAAPKSSQNSVDDDYYYQSVQIAQPYQQQIHYDKIKEYQRFQEQNEEIAKYAAMNPKFYQPNSVHASPSNSGNINFIKKEEEYNMDGLADILQTICEISGGDPPKKPQEDELLIREMNKKKSLRDYNVLTLLKEQELRSPNGVKILESGSALQQGNHKLSSFQGLAQTFIDPERRKQMHKILLGQMD